MTRSRGTDLPRVGAEPATDLRARGASSGLEACDCARALCHDSVSVGGPPTLDGRPASRVFHLRFRLLVLGWRGAIGSRRAKTVNSFSGILTEVAAFLRPL